ncbi:MAG: TIGR04219 family outer membrane beta-barrel protein [Sulfurovum sp.]|nr:TIGR04219 family outer membrane beta-barrel protein [Sulfurovum sp.]
MIRSFVKTLCSTLLVSLSVHADTIGGEIALGVYSHTPKGYATYSFYDKEAKTSVEDTLNWKGSSDLFFKAYFEHPLPYLPNLKLEYSNFSHKGSGKVSDFSWGGISAFTGDIYNTMDMRAFDVTLYYELLDNWASLDAGLTLRRIYGDIYLETKMVMMNQSYHYEPERAEYDEWIPMVYLKTRFELPTTELMFQTELNAISYEGATMYDALFTLRYTFGMGLGIEGGYRLIHLGDNDLGANLAIDVDFRGPYAAVVWNF